MYGRKRQIPRHVGEQIIGGRALLGAATSGLKSLGGQLFDGKKGVDFAQVGKDALGGGGGSIHLVGGMLQNKIAGGGAQAQAPGQGGTQAQTPGLMGMLNQGGGQGLMNMAKGFMGMEAGGGIPHNPDLAGAPYKMRGVKLMKAGGINEYGGGGNVYANDGVNTTGAQQQPQTEGDVLRQEMLAARQSERDMANSGGLGRRALDMSRGVDMDRSSSGLLDFGAEYSGPKYRMAELNEISRGAYGKDIDYDRLAASMDNASSRHKSALSNILANQTAMNQQRVGGVVLKKKTISADGGALSDPPKADWLLKYGDQDIDSAIAEEARDLSKARSDRESAFGTSSTDVFMPVGNIPTMPDPEPTEEPTPRLDPVEPLRRLGPKIIRRDTNRDIEGGTRKFEPEQDFDMDFIFDQTPLPRSDKDVRYSMYQKTMGVKDPRTGKYYYIDGARGFSGPKGKNMLSISSLPEDQRARALRAIEDQEMMFATQSDAYRRQRGL